MAMPRVAAAALLACILLPLMSVRGRNITTMLAGYKEYKLYNKYLSETRVCDEINDRQSTSMTILVLADDAMSTLVSDAGESLPAIKNALRLLSVLDYYDRKKVKKYGGEKADTLYQATGDAVSATGNVKVTDVEDGKYGFSSATPDAEVSTVTKEVKTMPFKFAILEISAPIEFDGLFDTPSTSNLTRLLERAGCKQFAALVASSGVLKDYESAMDKGLTLFAPNDAAFQAKGAPNVKTMSGANVSTLLKYHALPAYYPMTSLKTVKASLPTLASGKAGKNAISVVAKGDDVALDAGGSKSRVADTVVDKAPFCLLAVDSLLVPAELAVAPDPDAPAPAPTEAPVNSPAEREPADAPSDSEAADHTEHKTKKAMSSNIASRPIGGSFAAMAALCSVVLAFIL